MSVQAQRKVVAGREGDDLAAIGLGSLRRDDADDEILFLASQFDDMGIGDDLVRRDGKAAAVAHEIGVGTVGRHQHDADHAAGSGGNVLLFGVHACRSGKSQKSGQEGGEATE